MEFFIGLLIGAALGLAMIGIYRNLSPPQRREPPELEKKCYHSEVKAPDYYQPQDFDQPKKYVSIPDKGPFRVERKDGHFNHYFDGIKTILELKSGVMGFHEEFVVSQFSDRYPNMSPAEISKMIRDAAGWHKKAREKS